MPRRPAWNGDCVFHVMNRAARRLRLFENDDDYQTFLMCVARSLHRIPIRLLAYCVMPNHFHLIVWPRGNGDLSAFMKLVTGTHSAHWHRSRGTSGSGAVYQGRYRAVPVLEDDRFLTVCRYVERNPLRAALVERAEDWPWSSLHQRCNKSTALVLNQWPIPQPPNWVVYVNRPEPTAELDAIRNATARGLPISAVGCQNLRSRGRPRKKGSGDFLRVT